MTATAVLSRIEKVIQSAKPEEQREFLAKLPHLLKLDAADFAFLKIAEGAFDFWDNPNDAVYSCLTKNMIPNTLYVG